MVTMVLVGKPSSVATELKLTTLEPLALFKTSTFIFLHNKMTRVPHRAVLRELLLWDLSHPQANNNLHLPYSIQYIYSKAFLYFVPTRWLLGLYTKPVCIKTYDDGPLVSMNKSNSLQFCCPTFMRSNRNNLLLLLSCVLALPIIKI